MSKYGILVDVLDRIRDEAKATDLAVRYHPASTDTESVNQARARAFIHLFLKVRFGLLEFTEREHFVTDGTQDGGIDGYFVHQASRTIYLLQSKFRTTEANFESKRIDLEEVLAMDINRILGGEGADERGVAYNGKIKRFAREIAGIDDIGRYKYRVVLLANIGNVAEERLRRLTGGYPIEVIDHDKCYRDLVFPVIAGTYFNAEDLSIYIDLSNKNAGSKISYTVATAYSECEITVLFVPTLEIAKVLSKYKNAILKYNPRSYLSLEGQKVNAEIRNTILGQTTNEFALFNNGITMISDETYINERIGQKNKAQLTVKNPQIINGGQTAYTLSRIFEERDIGTAEKVFEGKEVLLKVITLLRQNQAADESRKLELVDRISAATNQQTTVISADRHSNDQVFLQIQSMLFERYGLLFERKRGEFEDGLHKRYIVREQVLERNLFFRIYLASNGQITRAIEKKLFLRLDDPAQTMKDQGKLDRFYFGYLLFLRIGNPASPGVHRRRELYGQLYAMTQRYMPTHRTEFQAAVEACVRTFDVEWDRFALHIANTNVKHFTYALDSVTGERRRVFSPDRWYKSLDFEPDVKRYFG